MAVCSRYFALSCLVRAGFWAFFGLGSVRFRARFWDLGRHQHFLHFRHQIAQVEGL